MFIDGKFISRLSDKRTDMGYAGDSRKFRKYEFYESIYFLLLYSVVDGKRIICLERKQASAKPFLFCLFLIEQYPFGVLPLWPSRGSIRLDGRTKFPIC